MRGRFAIARHDGPAVVQRADAARAQIQHRLDAQHHAGLEQRPASRRAVVRDLRLLVHAAAAPVAHEFANHRDAAGVRHPLDGVRHVAEPRAGLRRGDGLHQRPFRVRQKPQHRGIRHVDGDCLRVVTDEAVVPHPHVDAHDVAVLDLPVAGDAVDDGFVDGNASLRRIAHVAEERALHPERRHRVAGEVVEFLRGHAGLHGRAHDAQHLGGLPARLAHDVKLFRCLDDDRSRHSLPRGLCDFRVDCTRFAGRKEASTRLWR